MGIEDQRAQRNSGHRGPVGTEERWAQRNSRHRGKEGTSGTEGTEEQRAQRNRGHRGTVGTVGTERHNNNLYFKRVTPITMTSILHSGPLKTKLIIINYNNHDKKPIYK